MKEVERVELPISFKYVSSWGLHEALRELFQNSIDRIKEFPTNDNAYNIVYNYYKKHETLLIGNLNTILNRDSLVLGNSDKGENQVGKFGEGYKLATLVLLRMGYKIVIYNGSDVWFPAIEDSSCFNCKVLTFYIRETSRKSSDLVFAIHGLKHDDFQGYRAYNLNLQRPYSKESTEYGEIIYTEQHKGRVFVEGLYVCSMESNDFYYGYNFRAGKIPLGRDRNKLNSFDLSWAVAKMLKDLDPKHDDEIIDLMKSHARDVQCFTDIVVDSGVIERVGERAYRDFKDSYGNNVFPVGSSEKEDLLKHKYENILVKHVPDKLAAVMELCESYRTDLGNLKKRENLTPREFLKKFFEDNSPYFSPTLAERFEGEVIRKSVEWRNCTNE